MVDYPNSSKKRKMYLCLMVGHQEVPSGLTEGMDVEDGSSTKVKNEKRRKARAMASNKMKGKKALGSVDKDWILKKKELYRQRKGVEQVPRDSKVRQTPPVMSRSIALIIFSQCRSSLEGRERPASNMLRRRCLVPLSTHCILGAVLYVSETAEMLLPHASISSPSSNAPPLHSPSQSIETRFPPGISQFGGS